MFSIIEKEYKPEIVISIVRALRKTPQPLRIIQVILKDIMVISKKKGVWMLLNVIATGHGPVLEWILQDPRFKLTSHLGKGLLVGIKLKKYSVVKIITKYIHLRSSRDSNLLLLVSIANQYLASASNR